LSVIVRRILRDGRVPAPRVLFSASAYPAKPYPTATAALHPAKYGSVQGLPKRVIDVAQRIGTGAAGYVRPNLQEAFPTSSSYRVRATRLNKTLGPRRSG
jgi:hypothetical protein